MTIRTEGFAYGSASDRRSPAARNFPLVVHSHLRWSFVWQRPQQTHSRLARTHPVLFVEEPLWVEPGEHARLELSDAHRNVIVAQPALPRTLEGRQEAIDEAVGDLLRNAVSGPLASFAAAVHWLYTPQMEPQLAAFPAPRAVVYDCMDELRQFAHAPAGLELCERRLLQRADVVFTGGYELYQAKRRLHGNVHFFGCGVDFDHFHRAAGPLPLPDDLATIPGPRLGYFGVVDERLDYDLIASLSAGGADWSIIVIGPVVKVDEAALPRARNLFYLGGRAYDELPSYLAGFDVCLMPFALNEATEFINPTKTLEYLASGKPVVSTPVRDVVRNFGHLVHIAEARSFEAEVRRVLAGERLDAEHGLQAAREASWDVMVAAMEERIESVLTRARLVVPPARDGRSRRRRVPA